MSWQDLVNNNLIGSGNVSKAAIIGLDGQIWGKSDNFNISQAEANAAANGFQQQDALLGTGLKFENEKFFVLRADDERIIGKKASNGFIIYKTGQGNRSTFSIFLSRVKAITFSCHNLHLRGRCPTRAM